MDYHLTRKSCKEVLEEKARNPNTAAIPVVLTAQKIDKNRLLELVQYNIRKVFMKPIKMDAFFQIISEITGARFEVDKTPCILEAHVNDNIVFVELAKGINREKVDLLRFKIRELLDLYAIQKPRVLLMLSDMELSFVDGPNLEILLETVSQSSRAKARNVKVLTRSGFVKEFVSGRPEFSEIEVVANLANALDGLVADAAISSDEPDRKTSIITDRILSTQGRASGGESIEMRFEAENARPRLSMESAKHLGDGLDIAVVDDDFVIQELLKTTFEAINAKVNTFSNGREFLTAVRSRVFDLVFLDLRMPEVDGFGVLAELRAQDLEMPIIVLSAVTQRESVVKAFQAGVKSYLVKPLKPEHILRKTLEILKANF
ncbi:MAG: response regulator [Spirochaetes bacterium RIFOXYC1_FULL_54_7]|nr:MAG: response regulator [Spirochaetes bacterium RIFOXYC1_FULL_54_7]